MKQQNPITAMAGHQFSMISYGTSSNQSLMEKETSRFCEEMQSVQNS